MSNRTLGFLIIFGFIAAGFLFYQYFFVFNLVSLNINSNVGGYSVELKNIKSNTSEKCLEKKCEILGLSPFEYSLKISKDGYNSYNETIELKNSKTIDIKLEKKIVFEKIVKNLEEKPSKTREEIIEGIKKVKDSYKIINLPNTGEFIFKELSGKLELSHLDKKIGSFKKEPKNKISIQEVIGDNNYILVSIGLHKYLINLKIINPKRIDLKPKINYIKYSNDKLKFQLVTYNGTFIYNLKDNSIKYFSRFSDFIIVKDGFIAVVDIDDKIRKKNLGYENKTGSLIVYLNTLTSEKTILKELNFKIAKIVSETDYVKVISEEGEEYRLENY